MRQTVTPPAVVVGHVSDQECFRQETLENRSDSYILTLPLCRGRATLRCEGGTIFDGDVRPGMLRVFAPGEQVQLIRQSRAEAAVLTMAGPWFRTAVGESGFRRRPGGLTDVDPILQPIDDVARLALVLSSAPAVDPAQRPLFVEGIAHTLLALTLSRQGACGWDAAPGHGLSDQQFARCVDYVDAHIADRVDLARWAAVLGLSTNEFARRFQQRAGVPPYAWLLEWRVGRAKQILATADMPLADVALLVGFSSQSHFTDAFRRRVGVPPGRWRTAARVSPSAGR